MWLFVNFVSYGAHFFFTVFRILVEGEERQTGRQTDRQTVRKADIQIDRESDRQTERERVKYKHCDREGKECKRK